MRFSLTILLAFLLFSCGMEQSPDGVEIRDSYYTYVFENKTDDEISVTVHANTYGEESGSQPKTVKIKAGEGGSCYKHKVSSKNLLDGKVSEHQDWSHVTHVEVVSKGRKIILDSLNRGYTFELMEYKNIDSEGIYSYTISEDDFQGLEPSDIVIEEIKNKYEIEMSIKVLRFNKKRGLIWEICLDDNTFLDRCFGQVFFNLEFKDGYKGRFSTDYNKLNKDCDKYSVMHFVALGNSTEHWKRLKDADEGDVKIIDVVVEDCTQQRNTVFKGRVIPKFVK